MTRKYLKILAWEWYFASLLKKSLLSETFTCPWKEEESLGIRKRKLWGPHHRWCKCRNKHFAVYTVARGLGHAGTVPFSAWKQTTSGFCRKTSAIHAQAKGRGNTVSFFLLRLPRCSVQLREKHGFASVPVDPRNQSWADWWSSVMINVKSPLVTN